MAVEKTQQYNGKDVVITQNPLNGLFYAQEQIDPKDQAAKPNIIGLARDEGFTGYGYKTKENVQYAIDNQLPAPDPTASNTLGVSGTASGI